MTKHTRYILFLLVLAALYGCASRKNNTATSRAYHAFFARYNTYYNGNVAYKKAHKTQINGHKDNYLEQLSLLIISNAIIEGRSSLHDFFGRYIVAVKKRNLNPPSLTAAQPRP